MGGFYANLQKCKVSLIGMKNEGTEIIEDIFRAYTHNGLNKCKWVQQPTNVCKAFRGCMTPGYRGDIDPGAGRRESRQ